MRAVLALLRQLLSRPSTHQRRSPERLVHYHHDGRIQCAYVRLPERTALRAYGFKRADPDALEEVCEALNRVLPPSICVTVDDLVLSAPLQAPAVEDSV